MRERHVIMGVGVDYVEQPTKSGKQNLITYTVGNVPSCCGANFCFVKSFNKRYPKQAAKALAELAGAAISTRSLNLFSTEDPEVVKMMSDNGFQVISTRSKRTVLVLDRGAEDFTPYDTEEEDEEW